MVLTEISTYILYELIVRVYKYITIRLDLTDRLLHLPYPRRSEEQLGQNDTVLTILVRIAI
jgi:hypothetical protein